MTRASPARVERRQMLAARRSTTPKPPSTITMDDKGRFNGSCNVTACQQPGAAWYNSSTRAYYCASCAREINYWSKRDDDIIICTPVAEDVLAPGRTPPPFPRRASRS
jgi:hypothetical protein